MMRPVPRGLFSPSRARSSNGILAGSHPERAYRWMPEAGYAADLWGEMPLMFAAAEVQEPGVVLSLAVS